MTILIVLPVLTLLMFELGLNLSMGDFRLFKERPRAVLVGLVGQVIVLPALAWLIAMAFHLEPLMLIGVVLIGCCPGGSSSNVFSLLARGDVALSVSLTACSSVLTLVTLPIVMELVTSWLGSAVSIHLPVGKLIMQNLVLMFLPIALGIYIKGRWPEAASRLHSVLSRLAVPLLVLLVAVFYFQNREVIASHIGLLGVCITLLVLASMASGGLLSRAARLSGKERKTIVIEVGMQNAAQAIALAASPLVFNNETIGIPAIIYSIMMNVLLLGYVFVSRRGDSDVPGR